MLVIAVDTGNRLMKTAHADPFVASLKEHGSVKPMVMGADWMFFNGNYFTFSSEHMPNRIDKTEDDAYYNLTLAAIAREIIMKRAVERMNIAGGKTPSFTEALQNAQLAKLSYNEEILLSVGLPPRDLNRSANDFRKYFLKNGRDLAIVYNGIKFHIHIVDVTVSPQGVAAIYPKSLFQLATKTRSAYIIDIGGYTVDLVALLDRKIEQDDKAFCSLNKGIIHMYNDVNRRLGERLGHKEELPGVMIDDIYNDESVNTPKEMVDVVKQCVDEYATSIIKTLEDKGYDLTTSQPIFVGGGSKLLEKTLRSVVQYPDPFFISDVRANAIGYEVLGNTIAAGMRKGK